jgi:hypothetical protein
MQFKGTCIAVEDSSYQSKRSGRVGQMTLTCLDADTGAAAEGYDRRSSAAGRI